MSKTELVTYVGTGVDGNPVEFDQWFVIVDGVNLGLLCKKPDSRIMPLLEGNKLSDEQWLPIVAECSTLAGHVVNPPFHFHVPPAEELLADEDEEDEDDDEQQDN
jgi:hypothetical protein